MTEKRLILQMGHGTDPTGDPHRAALHAAQDALRHAFLLPCPPLGHPTAHRLHLTIGLPQPDRLDPAALHAALAVAYPQYTFTLTLAPGGLAVPGLPHLAATAALAVLVPDSATQWWHCQLDGQEK